jgi:hypothetical protein
MIHFQNNSHSLDLFLLRLHDSPVFTTAFDDWASLSLGYGCSFVFCQSSEDRSIHPPEWQSAMEGNFSTNFVHIINEDLWSFDVKWSEGNVTSVSLRSSQQLESFAAKLSGDRVYIDITGLSHHVWAPLLRAILSKHQHVFAIYVEPADYSFSKTPTEGEIFDLSVRIRGISPIPGFTSLAQTDQDHVYYVPLLGFEGTRLLYFLNKLEPGRRVFPVIGVPGFRPEYPFHAYLGNKVGLKDSRSWKNVRFARANCPFSLFYVLEDIAEAHPGDVMLVAPIGTKPHGLGAVLFALSRPDSVELVYDHPIRKSGRTSGRDHLLVYELSSLVPLAP